MGSKIDEYSARVPEPWQRFIVLVELSLAGSLNKHLISVPATDEEITSLKQNIVDMVRLGPPGADPGFLQRGFK